MLAGSAPRTSATASTSWPPVHRRCWTGSTRSSAAWRSLTAQCAARTAATAGRDRGSPGNAASDGSLVPTLRVAIPSRLRTDTVCGTDTWTSSSTYPTIPA